MKKMRYALVVGIVGSALTSCATRLPSDPPGTAQASSTLFPSGQNDPVPEFVARSDHRHPDQPSPALALQLAAAAKLATPETASPATTSPEAVTSITPTHPQDEATIETLHVRTTAYHRDEADHFVFGSMSAMGTPLKARGPTRSAAADWSRFPAGTRFRIAGDPVIYVIDDYGSALVGTGTIDLYQPDDFAMERWGARQVDIEILSWGSAEKSLAILKNRAGHTHIDQMIAALKPSNSTASAGR